MLQKGISQDHERPDVAAHRNMFVNWWMEMKNRMLIYRRVDVSSARKYMLVTDKNITCTKGNEKVVIAKLKLEKVKDAKLDANESAAVAKWAARMCCDSARTALSEASSDSVILEADKLDYIGPATDVVGPLQTKIGISCRWKDGIYEVCSSRTDKAVKITRENRCH